jgi:signal transduction histidine kinase
MGLYLCRNIIGTLGGTIIVDSKLGIGTTFTLHIPDMAGR